MSNYPTKLNKNQSRKSHPEKAWLLNPHQVLNIADIFGLISQREKSIAVDMEYGNLIWNLESTSFSFNLCRVMDGIALCRTEVIQVMSHVSKYFKMSERK